MRILKRFFLKQKELPNGCILWNAAKDSSGYGRFSTGKVILPAHEFAFILYYKRLPNGELHHRCENKWCVNPLHLKEVTRSEHMLLHSKELCNHGHKISEVGRTKRGMCRACIKMHNENNKNSKLIWQWTNKRIRT